MVGRPFLVCLTVSNEGEARALGVYLSPFAFAGPEVPRLAGPTASSTLPLGAGESLVFSWTCAGASSGWTAFSVTVTAQDEYFRRAVWGWAESASFKVCRPAKLEAAGVLSRTTVSAGQWVVLKLTVTNTGEAEASDVRPFMADRSTAELRRLKGPSPAGPVTLAGGRSRRFAWGWLTRTPGDIALLPGLTGRDGSSGEDLSFTLTVIGRVLAPPVLTATVKAPAKRLNQKDRFEILVSARNDGEAAVAMRPPALRLQGSGRAVVRQPPLAETVSLTGGSSRSWAWQCEATGQGPVTIAADVSGRDVNSDQEVTAPPADVPTQIAIGVPRMSIGACYTAPKRADLGEEIIVYLTVVNSGAFVLDSIAPRPLSVEGDGAVTLEGGPSPVAMTIPVGGRATFMWRQRAMAPGSVQFVGTVVAWDGTVSPVARSNAVAISTMRKGTARRR